MTKNPILNALSAMAYILTVAMTMFYGLRHAPGPDTIIAPIAMISLLTLSAAVMGYIFLSQPLQLYLDGKKKEAIRLFTQTVILFAGITAIALFLLFTGIIE